MGIFSSIAGAVAGPLIGGLFGGKKETETTTKAAYDFDRLRDKALEAGFNPLTALYANGGTSGGTTTTTTPALSTKEVIGNALGAGVQTWFNQDAIERQEQIEQIQLDNMRTERDNLRQRANLLKSGGQPFGSTIPVYQTASGGPNVKTYNPEISNKDFAFNLEKTEVEAVRDVPLTAAYRTGAKGGDSYVSLNPDAWEIGIGELVGGAVVHAGSWAGNKLPALWDKAKETWKTSPASKHFETRKGSSSSRRNR